MHELTDLFLFYMRNMFTKKQPREVFPNSWFLRVRACCLRRLHLLNHVGYLEDMPIYKRVYLRLVLYVHSSVITHEKGH